MDISKLQNKLPIMRHFEENELVKVGESFQKGEKPLYNIMKLIIFGSLIYFSWIYVLPVVFKAIGRVLAIGGTIAAVVLLVFLSPVILKGIRRLTKTLHKAVIKAEPFAQLYDQIDKMIKNDKNFIKSRGKIKDLRHQMEIGAKESEERAKSLSKKITSLNDKSTSLREDMQNLVKKNGQSAKGEDVYVNKMAEFQKTLSEGQRTAHLLNQEKSFISKYGTRAHIMKKLEHKLILVGTAITIKIDDFKATIDILEKDYKFARETRMATDAAKNAMLFTTDWEFDYAMDVVTATIAQDIAISSANISDIDKYTSEYSLDSDELYANLNDVAEQIRVGEDPIPSARAYSGEDYELTHDDKLNSGGFPTVF